MNKRKSPEKKPDERQLDDTAADSFPASDPPAHSGVTGVGRRDGEPAKPAPRERGPSHERDHGERPTGYPTSDRHATETAHSWEDEG